MSLYAVLLGVVPVIVMITAVVTGVIGARFYVDELRRSAGK